MIVRRESTIIDYHVLFGLSWTSYITETNGIDLIVMFYPYLIFLYRTWEEGKAIIIDDSFDHEVWHNGSTFRLILIVDFWHPDLTPRQRASLSPI